MKRKHAARHENHERWLVSYADFITLLFAFFVVMFATAQKDKTKQRIVAESVREALQHGQLATTIQGIINQRKVTPDGKGDSRTHPDAAEPRKPDGKAPPANVPPASIPPPGVPPANKADLSKALATLNTVLKKEVREGSVSMKLEDRGLVISMRELAFFDSGDADIHPASLPVIQKIAAVIGTVPNAVRLEGHTDSVPIHNSRFRNNWELSTARSITLLEVLRDRFQVPEGRLSVAGYADNAPVDSNDTHDGRMHNRRVDLVVLSSEALRGEPAPQAKPAPVPKVPPAHH
jgi:chemotaxis protein MotB